MVNSILFRNLQLGQEGGKETGTAHNIGQVRINCTCSTPVLQIMSLLQWSQFPPKALLIAVLQRDPDIQCDSFQRLTSRRLVFKVLILHPIWEDFQFTDTQDYPRRRPRQLKPAQPIHTNTFLVILFAGLPPQTLP